jgi:hypothetical protein
MNRVTKRDKETGRILEFKCGCGRKVETEGCFDVECSCGAEYNSAGQRLADRSQWGEETGEMACDYDQGVAGYGF